MFEKKTKIIATIGPVSDTPAVVSKLIKAGLNIARVNFSHGDMADHEAKFQMLNDLIAKGANIAIMLDTKGPEIRTGEFKEGQATFVKGKTTTISMKPVLGTAELFSVSYAKLIDDVKKGDVMLLDDGKLILKIMAKNLQAKTLTCKVLNNRTIASRRGCVVPTAKLKLPFISEVDKQDLIFGCKHGMSYVAASFTREAADVLAIRKILDANHGQQVQIIAKIECQEGVNNIDEIIAVSDGIMVARGDLGVEVAPEEVPVIQKMIVNKCHQAGKPVIVATHMLDSMQHNPTPTRAEVSDVANAIYEACDSVMLSGESANGDFPVESVAMEARIATRIEKLLDAHAMAESAFDCSTHQHDEAIAYAVANSAVMTQAKLIVAFSESGATARRISKYRPACPIVSVSSNPQVARTLCLNWGVYGMTAEIGHNQTNDSAVALAKKIALSCGYKKHDTILLTGGNGKGSTNFMKIVVLD